MRTLAFAVDDINSEAGLLAGAVEFRRYPKPDGPVRGIAFRCPCRCGYRSWMPVRSPGEPHRGTLEWEFNGDLASPSTTPSILQSGLPCKWHGYLTNGEFVPC